MFYQLIQIVLQASEQVVNMLSYEQQHHSNTVYWNKS